MDLGLKDRVALVAASSRGLGKAVALGLAREGAKLVLCARTDATGSTVGLCGAFGRIDASDGAMVAGDSCRKPRCTASTGW